MADVLIRGIEMPDAEGCEVIIRIQPNGYVLDAHKIHIGATAIPLPEGHGRLGDLDALRKEFPEPEDWKDFSQAVQHISGIWATIDNAPTIIPAEGGEVV